MTFRISPKTGASSGWEAWASIHLLVSSGHDMVRVTYP